MYPPPPQKKGVAKSIYYIRDTKRIFNMLANLEQRIIFLHWTSTEVRRRDRKNIKIISIFGPGYRRFGCEEIIIRSREPTGLLQI